MSQIRVDRVPGMCAGLVFALGQGARRCDLYEPPAHDEISGEVVPGDAPEDEEGRGVPLSSLQVNYNYAMAMRRLLRRRVDGVPPLTRAGQETCGWEQHRALLHHFIRKTHGRQPLDRGPRYY